MSLSSEKLVSKSAFKWVNLYRYDWLNGEDLGEATPASLKTGVRGCTS